MNPGSSETRFGPGESSYQRPRSRDDFRIAIVCALEVESTAVAAMFDELWEPPMYGRLANDSNEYTAARIGEHNVVLAYLPGMGGSASAAAIANLLSSYQRIELALLVGICGAVPIDDRVGEIFLGDVVISDSIVQYDYGRRYPDKLRRKDGIAESLSRPNPRIRSFLHKTRTVQTRAQIQQQTRVFLEQMINDVNFSSWNRPSPETDKIYESSYRHKHQVPGVCAVCDKCQRDSDEVCETALTAPCDELGCNTVKSSVHDRTGTLLHSSIHFGTVASANLVMKSANDRDTIAKDEKAIAFEMEGAGLWDYVPTIIIKGVCDYADSHKNKNWQKYAAAASASCMKAFIEQWTPTDQRGPEEPRGYIELPNRRVTNFVGRSDTLGRIDRVLCSSRHGPRIATLCGIGGQGKTQVALEYCERKKNNPFRSILWIDAKSKSSLITSFEKIAELLRGINEDLRTSDAKVSSVLRKLAGWDTPWLLAFDNYDDVTAFDIQDYFPRGEAGGILVTSRHADTSELVYDSSTDHIELGGLDDASAISLLLGRRPDAEHAEIAVEAENVVHRLGNHPLAITQAAAYMKQQRIGPVKFLEHYVRRRETILKTAPKLTRYKRKLDEEQNESALNVYTTFELSFLQLEDQVGVNGVPVRLIALLSLFDHQSIQEELFMGYPRAKFAGAQLHGFDVLDSFFDEDSWNHERFTETLDSISALSLIQFSVEQENSFCRIGLHPLVKDWIRVRTDTRVLSEMSLVVTILLGQRIHCCWQDRDYIIGLDLKQEIVLHVLAQESNWDEFRVGTSLPLTPDMVDFYLPYQYWEGCFAEDMGYLDTAEKTIKRTWDTHRQIHGEEHCDTLAILSALAVIHSAQGRWKEAEAFQMHVVDVRGRVLGKGNFQTLESTADLVFTLKELGKRKEARDLILQARKTSLDNLGEEHPTTLKCTRYLIQTYVEEGDLKHAGQLCERTLEIERRILGDEHPSTLGTINSLMTVHLAKGQYQEAENLASYLVEVEKRTLGSSHYSTLLSMSNLAAVYSRQEKLEQARTLHLEVLKTQVRVLGKEHPRTLLSMHNLGALLENHGDSEAGEFLIQAVEGRRNVLGEEHPDTLASMSTLAQMYGKRKQLHDAETLTLQVLKRKKQIHGEEHADTLTAMNSLADLHYNMDRLQEAEKIYLQVLESRTRVLEEDSPDILTTKSNLANTYWKQGRLFEAENLELQVLEARIRIFGEESIHTLVAKENLAATYLEQKRLFEAEKLILQVLEARTRIFGEEHLDTLAAKERLVAIYLEQKRLVEAEKLVLPVVEARTRTLGEDHLDTLAAKEYLTVTYWKQGRLDEVEKLIRQLLERNTRVLGVRHPHTVRAMKALAMTYRQQKRDCEAEKLEQEATELKRRRITEDCTEMHERAWYEEASSESEASQDST